MRVHKSPGVALGFLSRWLGGQMRTVGGRKKTALRNRLIALVVLLSIATILLSATKLIWDRGRRDVRIATASKGGAYHAFGRTLAAVINEHESRMSAGVFTSAGSRENMRALEAREIDLALAQNDTAAGPSVRALARLFPETLHLIVAQDAGIDGVSDLRGKRIAAAASLLPEQAGGASFFTDFIG
ncbi:TAXI family TRAP transporter solute-binding subunit, partial [Candidatus Sumerlaeota bacterium]